MSLKYEIDLTESGIFGVNLLRINGIPESHDEFRKVISENPISIVRWKFPANYKNYNSILRDTRYDAEFSGAVRHLLFDNNAVSNIKYKNDVSFNRYDGSSEHRAVLRELIAKCYSHDALGVSSCPVASKLITKEKQLASMQNYFERFYIPAVHPENYFYFAIKNGVPSGFCALSIDDHTTYCPLGGVLPEQSRQGLFSDILLFSRQQSQKMAAPTIHMGIRADNDASMHVFLNHAYGDTGRVIRDWIDYVFFLTPRNMIAAS